MAAPLKRLHDLRKNGLQYVDREISKEKLKYLEENRLRKSRRSLRRA